MEVVKLKLNSALDDIVYRSLRPVAMGLAILYGLLAISHGLVLPQTIAPYMVVTALLTALTLFALSVFLKKDSIPRHWIYPVASGIAGLVLINSFLHLYLSAQPQQTTNLMLLIIGVSFFFLSTPWFALIVVITLAGWGMMVELLGPSPLWLHFGFALFQAVVVAILIHFVHLRSLRRIEGLRLRDEQQNAELRAKIAERRQVEEALRQSEEKYRSTMDAALAGIYVIQDLLFKYVNPTMARLFGYTPQELGGRLGPLDLIVPEQRDLVRNNLIQRAQGVPGKPYEIQGLRKDGSVFDALIWGKGITYLGRSASVGTLIDITERKGAETALRESEERFRQLVEHLEEVFWIASADGSQVFYVSPAYEKIRGRPCQRIYEHPTDWMEAIHPEDRSRLQDVHAKIVTTGEFNEEYRIIRPEGTVRWIWSRGFPIRDAAGRIYRIAGIGQDITERRQAEEKLRQQQAELAHMARFALAGEMASGLAHELNQPLGAIRTYTETCLLLIDSGQLEREPLTEIMEKVAAQAQRAGEIIHRLRNLVRKAEPHRSAVDINQLIQEVIRLLEPEARQQEVQIRLELDEVSPVVYADAIQIQQVVLNLVRNAIEAMGELPTEAKELIIRTISVGSDALEVTVSDTGPGLSPEEMEKLFMPFFTTKSTGMGLGLSISKSIIEAHKGNLWATPNPDQGVTFHFTLPYELRKSLR